MDSRLVGSSYRKKTLHTPTAEIKVIQIENLATGTKQLLYQREKLVGCRGDSSEEAKMRFRVSTPMSEEVVTITNLPEAMDRAERNMGWLREE